MDDEIDLIKLNIYIEINENNIIDNNIKNLKLFCKTFGKPKIFTKEHIIYEEYEYKCEYLYENDWFKIPLKDNNLRHKCVYYDGNFIIQIIEFEDEYYVIDMNTS